MRSLSKFSQIFNQNLNFKLPISKMIHLVNDSQQFDAEIANAGEKLVIVDFGAQWCAPCKSIAPEFERLAKEYDSAVFLKVDVDECTELAVRDGIAALPTFVLYKNKVKLDRVQGSAMQVLEDRIRNHLLGSDDEASSSDASTGTSTETLDKEKTPTGSTTAVQNVKSSQNDSKRGSSTSKKSLAQLFSRSKSTQQKSSSSHSNK